jgi:predicted GIY-YIG superfamily endonuclease
MKPRHFVYVIKMRGIRRGIVKIGYSADVTQRMQSLKSMILEVAPLLGVTLKRDPDPRLLRVLSFQDKSSAEAAERDLKAHYWKSRLQGEYFRLPSREVAKLARKGYVERVIRGYARWDKEHGPRTLADFVALGLVQARASVYVNWPRGDALRAFQDDLKAKRVAPPPPEAYYLNPTPSKGDDSPLLPWTGSVVVRPLCGSLPASVREELGKVAGKNKLKKASKGGIKTYSNAAFLHVATLGVWDKAAQQANRSKAASSSKGQMPAFASP